MIEGFHGVPYDKPLGRTREIIDLVRRGLRRETLDPRRHLHAAAPRGTGHRARQAAQAADQARASEHPALDRGARAEERRRRPPSTPTAGCRSSTGPRRPPRSGATRCAKGTAKRQEGLAPLEISAGGMVAIGEGPETKALLDFARPHVRALRRRHGRARQELLQRPLPASTAARRRPRRSRTSTSAATSATPRPRSRSSGWRPATWSARRRTSRSGIAAFQEAGVTNLQVSAGRRRPGCHVRQLKECWRERLI